MNCEPAKHAAQRQCGQVQSLLVAYLEGEVTPSERSLIQAHLPNCTVCQQELTLLSTARSRVRSMLQRRAAHAAPSREAWNRLEVQVSFLPRAEQPSSKFEAWFSREAPNADHASHSHKFFGGVRMQKRSILSAIAGVLVLAVLAVFVARNAIPVSAREILNRAYEVESQAAPIQGIEHIRSEIYSNLEGLPEDQGMDTTVESYFDPASGNFRVVTIDNKTGKVLEAYAFDGSYAYNSESTKDGQPNDDPLTVYRSLQEQSSELIQKLGNGNERKPDAALEAEARDMFDKMRQDPQVELAGQETWGDGRTVYVLRSQQTIKLLVGNEVTHPMGQVIVYFDVDTYQLLGSRVTMEKDGSELLISSQRILVDEILPEGSQVAWDLSDLQGIAILDDPNSEHAAPEAITVEQLASKTDTAYLLVDIPNGFSLEISALPEQPANEPFFYRATYSKGEDYFMIRTWGEPIKDASWADETYTTASGLVLHFIVEPGVTRSGGEFISALVEAPNGMTYAVNSTLPRERIKELAEELVLVQ